MRLGLGLGFTKASGGAAPFSPADLFTGGVAGAWYDPSDLSSMWQDSAGTTPAAVDSPVGKINDKSGNGNHLTQATASRRPILRSAGGLFCLEFDGIDDCLATQSARTFPAIMDLFAGIGNNVPDTSFATFCQGPESGGGDPYYLVGVSGGGGNVNLKAGASGTGTTFVNGVQLSSEDRGVYYTALGSTPKVAEVHDADTAGTPTLTQLNLCGYTTFNFGGRIYGATFLPSQTTANRNSLRTYLGAKAGLSL